MPAVDNGPQPSDDTFSLAPHSIEAEEALLGSLLMSFGDAPTMTKVQAIIEPDDFFNIKHGWIYEAMLRAYQKDGALDTRRVAEELRSQKYDPKREETYLDDVGGEAYLRFLPTTVPHSLNAHIYADIVAVASTRRKLLGAAQSLVQLANDTTNNIDVVMSEAAQLVASVALRKARASFVTAFDATTRIFTEIRDGIEAGAKTGFRDIDKLFRRGLVRGQIWTVAGRPAMGKSAFCLRIARNIASGKSMPKDADGQLQKGKVLLFTLEMTDYDHQIRLISEAMGLPINEVEDMKEGDPNWEKFRTACGDVGYLDITYEETAMTLPAMESAIMEYIADNSGLDLIIIDRIGLIKVDGISAEADNKLLTIVENELLRFCKTYAPILQVVQLNRDVEKRSDKRPMLSDLRMSGSIEQVTQVAMMMYRPHYYDENEDRNDARVLIRKNRQGDTGEIQLFFRPELTGFYDMAWE